MSNLFRTGNQSCRIARPARANLYAYFFSGNPPRRLNHFADAVTPAATTKIIDAASLINCAQRQNVSARQIDNVDVIAYAGPIARSVIITKDFHLLSFAR